jgi:hypothetical protein
MVISIVEPSEPEPEPHRVTAPAPSLTKRCGSLRLWLRLRKTGLSVKIYDRLAIFLFVLEREKGAENGKYVCY